MTGTEDVGSAEGTGRAERGYWRGYRDALNKAAAEIAVLRQLYPNSPWGHCYNIVVERIRAMPVPDKPAEVH